MGKMKHATRWLLITVLVGSTHAIYFPNLDAAVKGLPELSMLASQFDTVAPTLAAQLRAPGFTGTLFAPTNATLSPLAKYQSLMPAAMMIDTFSMAVIPGAPLKLTDLKNGAVLTTLNNKTVTVTVTQAADGSGPIYYINKARIMAGNVYAGTSILHETFGLIVPPANQALLNTLGPKDVASPSASVNLSPQGPPQPSPSPSPAVASSSPSPAATPSPSPAAVASPSPAVVVTPSPSPAPTNPSPAVSPSPAVASPTPSPAVATPSPSPAAASPSPAPATASPSPAPASGGVTASPAPAVASPSPSPAVASPAPAKSPSPSPSPALVSPSPAVNPARSPSPSPAPTTSSPVPADSTDEDVIAVPQPLPLPSPSPKPSGVITESGQANSTMPIISRNSTLPGAYSAGSRTLVSLAALAAPAIMAAVLL